MDISVVVPFHNEEEHLEGCIHALRALEYPADRREIILVDKNSTDRSVAAVGTDFVLHQRIHVC